MRAAVKVKESGGLDSRSLTEGRQEPFSPSEATRLLVRRAARRDRGLAIRPRGAAQATTWVAVCALVTGAYFLGQQSQKKRVDASRQIALQATLEAETAGIKAYQASRVARLWQGQLRECLAGKPARLWRQVLAIEKDLEPMPVTARR